MKKLLLKNIKWFIVIFISATLIWSFIFDNINAPKKHEKIDIFITADVVNKNAITYKINNNSLKQITITNCSENDQYYSATLETIGIISSDILIVKDDLVLTEGATTSFIELEENYLNQFNINLHDFELIYVDETPYAIVVYDESKSINLLKDYITFDNKNEIYCLVLNNISAHIGKYSTTEKNTTIAFDIIYKLLY